ncbi:LysR family transcriptional regulator [Oxalobacteraceae bacterium OM1]|nr:LysR family transcriptional regulator [Oxalobacteraceae bacterium OM1]
MSSVASAKSHENPKNNPFIVQKFTEKPAQSLAWDDVRYFLELARQETLSGAARVLGVEHSTVARRVTALEAQLGLRLFERLPKRWNLTTEGEQLLGPAQRIEDEALAFSRASLGMGSLQGTVRVSAPPAFASHFIVPRLAALHARWAGIQIEMVGEAREADLLRREADLALRLSRPEAPSLSARPLAELGYGLYAAPRWLAAPSEEWQFIGYEGSLRETPQNQWLEQLAGTRPVVFRANDVAALHQACRAGLGLAALPHFLARGDVALAAVPDGACPVRRPLWLAIHPDVRRSPRVKAIADILTDLFREHAQALG